MRILTSQRTTPSAPASVAHVAEIPLGSDLDDEALAEVYAYPTEGRWLRVNFIASLDGAAQGPDGRSGSISGRPDRRVLALLRALSDVVLVGAGTARAEAYGPAGIRPAFAGIRERLDMPPTPPIAVVTESLDVPEKLLGDPRTIVLTSGRAPAHRRARLSGLVDVAVTGENGVDMDEMVAALVARGHRRILCEGGPTLFAGLLARSLVDELCLTSSPTLLAGPALRITHGPELAEPTRLDLATVLEEDGFLFQRWFTGSAAVS